MNDNGHKESASQLKTDVTEDLLFVETYYSVQVGS